MWQAVGSVEVRLKPDPREEEEEEMSSQEFEQVSASLAAVGSRVDRLEAQVAALRAPSPPAPRTYTVRDGDTLSGIAAHLGLPDWRRLYEANRAVIGGDPNLIQPGQVLVVP